MKRFLLSLALLLLCITPSHAAEISAPVGEAFVTLNTEPCESKFILDRIKKEYHSQFKSGTVRLPSVDHLVNLCWMPFPDGGEILVADELGNIGPIPMRAFVKQPDESI